MYRVRAGLPENATPIKPAPSAAKASGFLPVALSTGSPCDSTSAGVVSHLSDDHEGICMIRCTWAGEGMPRRRFSATSGTGLRPCPSDPGAGVSPPQMVLWFNHQGGLAWPPAWVHSHLIDNEAAIAAYLIVVVVLALFVGWAFERSRRRDWRRYSAFSGSDRDED